MNVSDNTHLEDVGRVSPLCHQRAERVESQQKQPEHCTPFSLRQHQTQASPSGLPLARTPSNGDTRTRTTTLTVVSHAQPDVTILSCKLLLVIVRWRRHSCDCLLDNQLLQVERKRLQALLPPAMPLVPRENPSKASFLERLIPRRRVRGLSRPREIKCNHSVIFIQSSAHTRCRSITRQP